MRDLDDEFDSTDVVRYVNLAQREEDFESEADTGPGSEDDQLDVVLAALTDEDEPAEPKRVSDYFARRK